MNLIEQPGSEGDTSIVASTHSVLDAVAAEIVVVDRQGRIVAINAPWQRFSEENSFTPGLPAANTLVGSSYFAACCVVPDSPGYADAVKARNGIDAVLEGRQPEFIMDYPCDSPTQQRWFSMVVRPLGDDAKDGLVITHTDISRIKFAEAMAQKRLDERLQAEIEANKLFQAIEQSPIAICITDTTGVIEYVNPFFLALTNYSRQELCGSSIEILNADHANASSVQLLQEAIVAGKFWQGVVCNRISNDKLIYSNTLLAPIRNLSGEITHYALVMEDVTDRLKAERELSEYRCRLEELVQQRTAELSDALEAARLADLSKNAFFANITHELRTPLCAVIGFADLARPLSQDVSQRQYIDNIINAGKTLKGTIDDILDLSKIIAGRLQFEKKPFSVRSLVERCASFISYKVAEKRLKLVNVVSENVPETLIGDALRIEQILLNLLSNAVKFTEQGMIRLDIAVKAVKADAVCLQLIVEDTGIGIKEEEIALLFKPFSQADASITRRFGGTGLGLAICDQLAKMMDGQIYVESSYGEGTRFFVEIWLAPGHPDTLLNEDETLDDWNVQYRQTRVLVVDDQLLNRELVANLLDSVGIESSLACNGEEAIELLTDDPNDFDAVLMDIQMPSMDGLTATRELRNKPRFKNLPIIAMTAHTMNHERAVSALAGMNDHIGKPFDGKQFYRVLAKWISPNKQFIAPATYTPLLVPKNPQPLIPEMPGIDSRETIRLMQGDVGRYFHWLNEFLESGPQAVSLIRSTLAANDRKQASMAAHQVKGRTGFLGMHEAYALASRLELDISNGGDGDEILEQLGSCIDALCASIRVALDLAQYRTVENV